MSIPTDDTHDPEQIAEELNREYITYVQQFRRTSDLSKLRTALDCITRAVELTAGDDSAKSSTRAAHLTNLGRCHGLLLDATGDTEHLDKSLDAIELSVEAAPESSEVRPLCYINYSDAFAKRYFLRSNRVDLENGLEQARLAVAAAPPRSIHSGSAKSTLASRLAQYFQYIERDDRYMNEAIQISQELVLETPEDDDLYAVHVFNLAGDLQNRYQRYGDLNDLLSAKDLLARSRELFPPGNPNHILAVRQYASAVYDIADRTSKSTEIQSVIEDLTKIESEIHNPQELAKVFHEKSRLYAMKYEIFSDSSDLDQSIIAAENALHNTSHDSGIRGIILQRLSSSLGSRAELRMSLDDIDDAIAYARETATLAAEVPVRESAALDNVARRLAQKYQLFGNIDNLKEALKCNLRAIDLIPKDHAGRSRKLHATAICLRDHFEHYGQLHFLDESIVMEREAIEALPQGHADRGMPLDGLSHSLRKRSKFTGNSRDLDEAIIASEAAVESLPSGHQMRPAYLNGLANCLDSRAARENSLKDSDRAIEAVTEAINACAEGSSSEPIYLATLSNCLSARFSKFGDTEALTKSIQTLRNCLTKVAVPNPLRIDIMHNLGLRLQEKYQITANQDDKRECLEESLALAQQCVDKTPEGHPSLPIYLQQLGTRQLFLATLMEGASDNELMAQMAVAASTYDRSFSIETETPLRRIQTAQLGGYLHMQGNNWEKASAMLADSVGLFRRVSPLSLDDNDRQRQLRGLSGISSLACASFIALEKPDKALEVLEAGRGIMANIAMGYHADLSDLRTAAPQLHERYTSLRETLSQPLPETRNPSHGDDLVAKRNADLAEFQALESEIRGLPGLESFNQSLTATELMSMAVLGPVVAFCTVHQRCDALIVTPKRIHALPLPELKEEEIKERVGFVVGTSRLSKMPPSKRGIANRKMRLMLEWLWIKAVEPVLQHLDLLGDKVLTSEEKKRLWWVTSGPLGLLPLHAAGMGDKKPSRNTYARVISSYVPSFSSLAFSRRCQAKVDTASSAIAVITMPETPGGLSPLNTAAESRAIHEVFKSSTSVHTNLYELVQPSAPQVLNLVRQSSIDMLHLACHAEPDLEDPSNTALLFGSDPSASKLDSLPVSKLRSLHTLPPTKHRPPRLAYLSACCTAQQYDLRLIDENIHLASAFQLCGFPAVVGTLWEADDSAAVVVAERFYQELFRLNAKGNGASGECIARALDLAVGVYRGMKIGRVSAVTDPLAWASFVHIGA